MVERKHYDALALLSGGLDSILAMRTVMDQGLAVLGLHFVTPFFGKPHLIPFWRSHYGIEVIEVDIRQKYVDMILDGPTQGFGKWLNPCIDCKIIMLDHALSLLDTYSAKFIISGEVVGQRPMSQRPDALNLISKRARVRDVLLRPLSAKNLPSTPVEESGVVDRERLHDWSGRGRKPQYALAEHYGFTEIPTPAGGCCLTEASGAGRFAQLLFHKQRPTPNDFSLARLGRQCWVGDHWLIFGRTAEDNDRIEALIEPTDYVFKLAQFPGPLAVARPVSGDWSQAVLLDAAALVASYSGKARKRFESSGDLVHVLLRRGEKVNTVSVAPTRETEFDWAAPKPQCVKDWKKEQAAEPE